MNKEKIILFIIALFLCIPLIEAFGATAPYWKDQPLIMSPGETKTIPIILQNMVGGKDITLKGEIISGSEIAILTDSSQSYFVPFGKENIEANLKIEIPKIAKKGDKYTLTVFFKQISKTDGEMLQIASGVASSFPIIIEKEILESPQQKAEPANSPSSPKYFLYFIITTIMISIISITIILFFLIKKQNPNFTRETLNEHLILHNKQSFLNN